MARKAYYPLLAARSFDKILRSKRGNLLERHELFGGLLASLFEEERLILTLRKAKDLSRFTQRAIDLAKEGDKDLIYYWLTNKHLMPKVFDVLVPRYADQKDGYTKVFNILPDKSNSGKMGLIELVGNNLPPVMKSEEELVKLQMDLWRKQEALEIPKEGTLV